MKNIITQYWNRKFKRVHWTNLRSVTPISNVFGFDRGTPIDRFYIEKFLRNNERSICGVVCEIGDNTYSKKFGSNVQKFEVLHVTADNKDATMVGDLTDISSLPNAMFDCVILTQTLNFIYDFQVAIEGLYTTLKQDGTALVTVGGISPISRYDMDKWGDFWRFTDASMQRAFEKVFGEGNVEVSIYGNVLSSVAFLEGISAEELTSDELLFRDENFQVTIAIKATKA